MMTKRNVTGAVFVTALIALTGQAVAAEGVISPWPPVTQDRHAPQNWPVPHPAPAVDLNQIPAGIVFRNLTVKERRAVQASLARVGYYDGPVDGIWGPRTWAGTVAYAERVGIRPFLNDVHRSLRVFQHITN